MERIGSGQLYLEQLSNKDGLVNPAYLKDIPNVDVIFVASLLFAAVSTLAFSRKVWKRGADEPSKNDVALGDSQRCVIRAMEENNKNCVIFWGSQTGNAQDFAERLVKEGHSRFNLQTMEANLEDYDYKTLENFPSDKIAIFILSSYGEGEPTDNAAQFYEFITSDEPVFSEDKDLPLQSMKYAAFGLGNSTYEHFNGVVRKVDDCLQRLGATPIAKTGEGDDGKGTLEDDFMAWKDIMWESVKNAMGLEEHEESYQPTFSIVEETATTEGIFLGERCKSELLGTRTEYGPNSPYIAKVLSSNELFKSQDRNCLHVDIDIQGSGLVYETGDHVAIWPSNSDIEVDRFLRAFGLLEKRHSTIHITVIDSTKPIPFPSPTTYDAAVRYYMEICGPISRQFLSTLALFATDNSQKETLLQLSKDKEAFSERIGSKLLNLAQLMELINSGTHSHPAFPVPFEVLVEGIRALKPRYYSISSSSLVQKDSVSLTVGVESVGMTERCFKGVASNYLLALKRIQNGEQPAPNESTYAVTGPRGKYSMSIPVHIRHSSFKLPRDSTRPIVMIGPGTGVAPFRAFVQERIKQAEAGVPVGDMVLFFGCRTEQEDFIYRDEWKMYEDAIGGKFKMYTAFSRQLAGKKVYVQQRIEEHAVEVRSLLLDQDGYIYVCGSSRMARDVQRTLSGLLQQPLGDGEVTVHQMKTAGRYQEDVW